MTAEDRIRQAGELYQRAVFHGDDDALADAGRVLDKVEADTALARGRILHARFLLGRDRPGPPPAEDPAELALFQRALDVYQALNDTRGEAEALFWIGCLHQVIRRDNETAVPALSRSRTLAARTGDRATEAEALRHLGIAAHTAGRLDEAHEHLSESSRLARSSGALPLTAANMIGLAYIAAARSRDDEALRILDEAHAIATDQDAQAVVRQIGEARAQISGERHRG